MDLTSSFTALLPRDKGRHRGDETHKHTSKETLGGTQPTPPPQSCNTYTWRSCLCSKFNYPLIDTSQGYLRCRHELWFPRGATGSSLCPNREGPTPPLLIQCIFAWLTHTLAFTHQNKHICTSQPLPQPTPVQEVSLLIGNQSKIIH